MVDGGQCSRASLARTTKAARRKKIPGDQPMKAHLVGQWTEFVVGGVLNDSHVPSALALSGGEHLSVDGGGGVGGAEGH